MTEKPRDIETIFSAVLKLESETERSDYLNEVCGDDYTLRARIEALLKAHEDAGDFLKVDASDSNATLDDPPLTDGPGTKIGRYELLEQIGEGGMGLVYIAQQKKPVKRKVALKIIKPGMDSRQVIARFEAERQALAVLDHPNIARVFDAGTTKTGRPYFIMEYVKGVSITRYCDENKLSIEKRLRLFEEVCEGIHHAHQKGIIHRDLKPSNILVSVHGDRAVPKIIDFGIAKAVTQPLTEQTFVTFQGQLLGTPEYMSPEQVDLATQDIDTRSDIYSLGVVLYELLAGILPFEREAFANLGFTEVQRTIREQEPASPSTRLTGLGEEAKTIATSRDTHVVALARRLHRELEWIPLKAMRKDRCRRYKSASEMADDLRNYLHGNPLTAGPETATYRMQKFVRKHAGSVATVALVAVAIVLGLIVSTAMYLRAEKALQQEAVARAEAEDAKDKETAARTRAEQAEKVADDRAEDYRRGLYVNTIQLADARYHEGNIGPVRKMLESCPQDLRGWEWDRVNHVLDHSVMSFSAHAGFVYSIALSPDGKRVVSGGVDKVIKVWDIATGKQLNTLSEAHGEYTTCVEFSPDGKYIVSAGSDNVVKVWDATGGNEAITVIRPGNWVWTVAFSPDGKHIVSTGHATKLWDAATGAEISTFDGHQDGASYAAFSPDGKRIVSAGWEGVIKIWDATGGNKVMKITGHNYWIRAVSFSSNGKLLASGSDDKTIKIWDATTGSLVMTLRGHDGPIESVAFSPDNKYLVSGSADCTVRVWDIATGEEIRALRGHAGFVTSVVLTRDGKHIVSGSWDGTIKVWDATIDHEINRYLGHKSLVKSVAFSPDGKRLVSHSKGGKVKVWDVASCAEVMTLSGGKGNYKNFRSTAFSPDGKQIASLGTEGAIKVWDAETWEEVTTLGTLGGQQEYVQCLAFSPNGQSIVSGSRDGKVKLWDVVKGEVIMTMAEDKRRVYSVNFSSDGQRIVSGSDDIHVWDATSGAELMTLIGHEGPIVNSVVFSPDGKRIASSCQEDGTARIWDAATGTELLTLRGHGDVVTAVAFSPDSKRLVTAGREGTARVWDSSTGDELLTLRAESGVMCVAFSPDGKSIAAGTLGKDIVLWESAAPAGGYGPRKTTVAARRIVDELHDKLGRYQDVIDQLKADKTLGEPVREVALQIANSRKLEDEENREQPVSDEQ